MFKKYPVIFFVFINLYLFSYTLVLKENIITKNSKVYLQDIILNDLPQNIPNIQIIDLKESKIDIPNNEILEILFSNSIFNINLIGENILINLDNNIQSEEEELNSEIKDPLEYLEDYFESFFGNKNFIFQIDLIKIEPDIYIKAVKSDYKWDLKKSYYALKELKEIKNLPINIDGNIYQATINIKIFSNIWTALQSFKRNDALKEDGFLKNYIDIAKLDNIDGIVFDIDRAKYSTFIENIDTGEILKWTQLKTNPFVTKGESIKAILKKNQYEIILPCTVINDGHEDEKIKVKLLNGKEIFGILRNNKGEVYLEIL